MKNKRNFVRDDPTAVHTLEKHSDQKKPERFLKKKKTKRSPLHPKEKATLSLLRGRRGHQGERNRRTRTRRKKTSVFLLSLPCVCTPKL